MGLLTDFWMALPSSLSLERTGPDEGMTGVPGQVGLRGTDPASCCLLTELFHALGILHRFEGFSSTMIYMPPTLKKNVKWFTIKHATNRVKAHF